MTLSLDGRVAIVTGAGAGLGRSHARLLARYGAHVVVQDIQADQAVAVAQEILSAGGKAEAAVCDISDRAAVEAMAAGLIEAHGGVDIVVNNAGLLRDRTFAKADLDDFRLVLDVHLMGSVYLTRAVWESMRRRQYGRIVFTTSSSGLYGNFGQSNYAAAKMALVGLMQTLALEGARDGIRVNCLAPSAATLMTNGLYENADLGRMSSDLVSPGVVALVGTDAPTRTLLLAGAGHYEQAHITMTKGLFVGDRSDAAEMVAAHWEMIADRRGERVPKSGAEQHQYEVTASAAACVRKI